MPSLSTTGLLQFTPDGFDYSRSLSNSMPGTNGLETFLMDPVFYGFAGDMVCMNVQASTSVAPGTALRVRASALVNSIMPMPWLAIDPNGPPLPTAPDAAIISCNPIGIAVSFKWSPLEGGGTLFRESPVFIANTPLFPGTFVEVTVLTDPFGVYTVQSNTPVSVGGIKPIISGIESWLVGTPTIQNYTLLVEGGTSYTFPFTMGEVPTTNPFSGGSRQYIYATDYAPAGFFPIPIDPVQPQSVLTLGLSKGIEGNNMTLPNGTIYPYIYFDGIMKSTAWNYVPPKPVNS